MAIEDIFRALEEQADSEVQEILRIAGAQAAAIEAEAREEADRITSNRVAAAEEAVRARANKTVNAARLDARRGLAAVREAAVEQVFAAAAEKLASLRGTPQYADVFTALAAEALAGVEGPCEMHVVPADADLAAKAIASIGAASCSIVPTLESIGGLTVTYSEGRVVRQNTFEARLAKARGLAAANVSEVLGS